MKKFILAICIAFVGAGCSNDDNTANTKTVFYNQTFCADPWGYGDNDSELASKIITFFADATIEIFKVNFDTKGEQQVCNACICQSGKRIFLQVNSDDLAAIKTYGFQQLN